LAIWSHGSRGRHQTNYHSWHEQDLSQAVPTMARLCINHVSISLPQSYFDFMDTHRPETRTSNQQRAAASIRTSPQTRRVRAGAI
jgi:hypothetical protein